MVFKLGGGWDLLGADEAGVDSLKRTRPLGIWSGLLHELSLTGSVFPFE